MPDENTVAGMTAEDAEQAIAARISDATGAGLVVAVDPDDAELMGAFADEALSPEDALDSRFDDVAEGE